MRKDYDESFDWGGFQAGLDASDARDDALDIKKMQDKYKGEFHIEDLFSGIGKVGTAIGGVVTMADPVIGGAIAAGGGLFGGIGDVLKKMDDQEETDKENAELDKRKLERSQAPTNQTYGMSLRNSGI